MTVVSRLDSIGNFAVANTGILDEYTLPTNIQTNGYATNFNGTSNYLVVPSNAAFAYGTGDFTIEFWLYPNTGSLGGRQDYVDNGTFVLWWNGVDGLEYYVGSSGGIVVVNAITENVWQHIALVRHSGNTKIYVNGIDSGSTFADTINYTGASPTYIARNQAAAVGYVNGSISNLRIVKGTPVYTSSFTPSNLPLTAISGTSLLTCQNSTIIDNGTANGGVGFTITNNSTTTSFPPQSNFYAASFNGSQYVIVPNAAGVASYTGNFTIEFWFYATTLTGAPFGLAAQYRLATGRSWIIDYDTNSSINAFGMNSGANSVPINTWHHLAVVKNGASFYLYINGKQAATTASLTPATSTENIYLGGNHDTTGGSVVWFFPGYISNFRVVKGTAVYTGAFTPSVNLTRVPGTSVITLQNSSLVDNSINGYTITNTTSVTTASIRSSEIFPIASQQSYDGNHKVAGMYDEVTITPLNQYTSYFNGTGNYLSIPSSTMFDFGTGDFTLEAWIYPIDAGRTADSSKYGAIISQYVSGSITNSWYFGLGISGGVFSSITFNSSDITRATATGLSYALNTWYHVACVRSSGIITLYINGVSVNSTSYSSAISYNASASVQINRSAYAGSYENWLKGYTSNLRVVRGTAVYTQNFTPTTAPLTPITGTSLLTCQNATIVDNSTNVFTITNTGPVTTSIPSPNPFKIVRQQYSSGDYFVSGVFDEVTGIT